MKTHGYIGESENERSGNEKKSVNNKNVEMILDG
jgi:hypothetical protein